jgi:hypothetical protein
MKHVSAGALGGKMVMASKLRLCTHENAHLTSSSPSKLPAQTRIGRPPLPLPGKPRSAHRPACAWCLCHMLPGPAGSQAGTRAQARKHQRKHQRMHARIRTHTRTHTSTHTHIHKQGKSRSAAVVAAYLIRTHGLTVAQGPSRVSSLL